MIWIMFVSMGRRLEISVPVDVTLVFYKPHIAPSGILQLTSVGINKTLINKLDAVNQPLCIKTLLNTRNASDYNSILSLASMHPLEY